MQFRFESPEMFLGLIAVGLLAIYMLWVRANRPRQFAWRRFGLIVLAFTALTTALARPQVGRRVANVQSKRTNLFVALDVSKSMLAEDITPNRSEFAIAFLEKLFDSLPEVRVSLFPFALTGYQQLPLTSDLLAAKDTLTALTPSVTTAQGSDLNDALSGLFQTITRSKASAEDHQEEWAPTQVLLLSDGESHYPVEEKTLALFAQAQIPISVVAVGTVQGANVPEDDSFGNFRAPLRDASGRIAVTKLDPETLKKIATLTGGGYFPARFEEISPVAARLTSSARLTKMTASFKLEAELFPWILVLGFLAYFAEFCFGRWQYAIRILPFCLFLVSTASAQAKTEAEEVLPTTAYNAAVERFEKGDFEKAAELFQQSALTTVDPALKKKAWYNLGNSFLKQGDPEQALQALQYARDAVTPDAETNREANERIAAEIELATRLQEKMQKQSGKQGSGEGKGGQAGNDPKGPKQFAAQTLTDGQREKLFNTISDEERQTLRRLRDERSRREPKFTDKPW